MVKCDIYCFSLCLKCHVSQKAATAVPHWRDQISGHNNSPRYRQKRKNQKAKIGSKVSIVGELDMHNNKLYAEFHNLDFLSLNTSTQITSTNQISCDYSTPTPFIIIGNKVLMYKSLFDKLKTITSPPNKPN